MENLNPEIIAAIVAILGAIATYIKSRADISSIRDERATTAQARDKDSQELHDKVEKCVWDIAHLNNSQLHTDQVLDDLRQQIGILNTSIATMSTKLDNVATVFTKLDSLTEAIKDLKAQQ